MILAGAHGRGDGGPFAYPGVQIASDHHPWISTSSFPRCSTACISQQFTCSPRGWHRLSLSAISPIFYQAGAARPQASRTNISPCGLLCRGTWISGAFCRELTEGWLPPLDFPGMTANAQTTSVAATRRHRRCRSTISGQQQGPANCSAVDRHVDAQLHPSAELNGFEVPSENLAGERAPLRGELGPSYDGKSGFVSFYQAGSLQREEHGPVSAAETPKLTKDWKSLLWILGPVTLVVSVVIPPLYLRTMSEALLQDSLLTDFVILFITESCFYAGALVFLYVADKICRDIPRGKASDYSVAADAIYYPLGYQVSTAVSLGLGVLLPIVTLVVVWSWTGPAAAAALLPYILGLLVQLSFQQIAWARNSSVWPVVPVIFQVYRLHQLNRAAQLVAGLLFSLRGAETTAETLAINGALRTLLSVLQLLGILSLWSLATFLSHGFPSGVRNIPGSSDLSA